MFCTYFPVIVWSRNVGLLADIPKWALRANDSPESLPKVSTLPQDLLLFYILVLTKHLFQGLPIAFRVSLSQW